jgi:hypothetical protein
MTRQEFPIAFGKVTYEPGAPKNAPRWCWACDCDKCKTLDWRERVRGPFRTRREAERDAESALMLTAAEDHGDQRH